MGEFRAMAAAQQRGQQTKFTDKRIQQAERRLTSSQQQAERTATRLENKAVQSAHVALINAYSRLATINRDMVLTAEGSPQRQQMQFATQQVQAEIQRLKGTMGASPTGASPPPEVMRKIGTAITMNKDNPEAISAILADGWRRGYDMSEFYQGAGEVEQAPPPGPQSSLPSNLHLASSRVPFSRRSGALPMPEIGGGRGGGYSAGGSVPAQGSTRAAILDSARQFGTGAVRIGDVVQATKLPLEEVQRELLAMSRQGTVVLHPSSLEPAKYAPHILDAGIKLPGHPDPYLLFTVKDKLGPRSEIPSAGLHTVAMRGDEAPRPMFEASGRGLGGYGGGGPRTTAPNYGNTIEALRLKSTTSPEYQQNLRAQVTSQIKPRTMESYIAERTKGMSTKEVLASEPFWGMAREHAATKGKSLTWGLENVAKRVLGRSLTEGELRQMLLDAARAGLLDTRPI
jgi:hypothetical protein